MRTAIKNYTSSVSSSSSVSQIEAYLVRIGASHISKTYTDGRLAGITFEIDLDGRAVIFKLPANVGEITTLMLNEVRRHRKGTVEKVRQQAERTAWKLLLDWVQVQSSMILIGRRQAMEVFLPYVYNDKTGQTVFEHFSKNNFKLLTSGT